MPDDACRAAREALGHQLRRLDVLLKHLNEGPSWPDDPIALSDAAFISQHAKSIEASLDEITRVVALMEGPPTQ